MLLPRLVAAVVATEHTWLSHLAQAWVYVTLGATSIVTEEAAPIIGGLAAHEGELGGVRVALACFIGSWSADIGLYFLGRWRGAWVQRRWPRVRRYVRRALTLVRRRPWRASLAVRFAYGLRLTLPIACGAAHISFLVYAIGSAISAAVWAALFTALGWGFGETALRVIGHVRRYEDAIAVGVLLLVTIVFIVLHRRNRVSEEVKHVVDHVVTGEDVPETLPRGD